MCGHLLRAGFPVTVYDPAAEAVAKVVADGGQAARSPVEVADASDVIFLMPGFYKQVEEALIGPKGALRSVREGATVIVAATTSPAEAKFLGTECTSRGVRFLDAPVCQGERGAREAYLVWLVGGERDVVEACRPVMEPCGKEIFHLGGVGAGMVGKAINNMLLWAALVADHEAVALAREHGVEEGVLIEALLRSSGTNWPLEHWADMHAIPWAHKDMGIVLEMADQTGLTMPIAGLLREQVKPLMVAAGWSDLIRRGRR